MRLWVAGLLAVFALGARPARAELIYEVAPLVGAGATDNVTVATDTGTEHFSDGFAQVGGVARARYKARLSESALGYRLMATRYVRESEFDALAQALAATSTISLTGRLTLRLYASGELTHMSSLNPNADPATVIPQAAIGGTRPYYGLSASEETAYAATPRLTYGETLSVARIHFLDSETNGSFPTTSLITVGGYGRRATGREAYSLSAILSDSIAEAAPGTPVDPLATGHVFFGQVLAGWGHELSPTWSTLLQAGPAIIFKLDGPAVLSPAAVASISYTRVPWFASLLVTQSPAPNLFVGEATISDQVIARVAVPLTRSEMIYVGGFGGYLYARAATASGSLARAYDQAQGGASLFVRSPRSPISAALTYVALSQRGNDSMDHPVESLAWQSVMLTVSGSFAWGPGTPPLFGGVL